MFPNLNSDTCKTSELVVTRHCTAGLRNRKSFEEGDKVVVYDNHRKLSYDAVVLEVLGTNNYLVSSDNGSKHVSGDVMSKAAQSTATDMAIPADADENAEDTVVLDDDNSSVVSEESDFELESVHNIPLNNNLNNNIVQNPNVNNRRGQREILNLGPAPLLPRLRSGRI